MQGLDGSQNTTAVFCDLSKACDREKKLNSTTFPIKLCPEWNHTSITESNDQYFQNSGNILSLWQKVRCGIHQGSILGPLLFLIFINDVGTNKKY